MTPSIVKVFKSSRLIATYAKTKDDKQKHIILAFQVQVSRDENFKISSLSIGFVTNGSSLTKKVNFGPVKYYDNLTELQWTNANFDEWNLIRDFELDSNDYLIVPIPEREQEDGNYPIRTYVFDLGLGEDAEQWKEYLNIWKNSPLNIYANFTEDSHELPADNLLAVEIDISDCDEVIATYQAYVDQILATMRESGQTVNIDDDEVNYIKGVINGTSDCFNNVAPPEEPSCNPQAYTVTNIQNYLVDIDKLICYLKNKIIQYKSQVTLVSANGMCYGFINCLIKSIVNLKNIYDKSLQMYQSLSISYCGLVVKWNNLVTVCKEAENAQTQIIENTTNWITENIDPRFEIANITCSQITSGTLSRFRYNLTSV